MNRQQLVPILVLTGGAALCWSAFALGADPINHTPRTKDEASLAEANTKLLIEVARMDHEKLKISSRLGMSAPMEIDVEGGPDPVMALYDAGVIVEVTLEEVEQALAAAVSTPGVEDDKMALDLKHRGSYRFFAPDTTAR